MPRKLTDSELYFIASSLRVAAEEYQACAAKFARGGDNDIPGVKKQFEDQVQLATRLADYFEEEAV